MKGKAKMLGSCKSRAAEFGPAPTVSASAPLDEPPGRLRHQTNRGSMLAGPSKVKSRPICRSNDPTSSKLIVNLKAAQALGLDTPLTLLGRLTRSSNILGLSLGRAREAQTLVSPCEARSPRTG